MTKFRKPRHFLYIFMHVLIFYFALLAHVYSILIVHNPTFHASSRRSEECKYGSKNCACLGTSNELSSISPNNLTHYARLKKSFVNCTRIIGNLELTHIQPEDLIVDYVNRTENATTIERVDTPFSFLKDLVEITGYLLVYHVEVENITLPKLRFILGENTFHGDALHLASSNNLRYFITPELRSIENGNVKISNCQNLCEWNPGLWGKNGVDYSEFLGENYTNRFSKDWKGKFNESCFPTQCDQKCSGSCFGPGPDQCQTVYHQCNGECSNGCYHDKATNKLRCCHEFCAGGCFGPNRDQCERCKKFEEDGMCVEQCRGTYNYNKATRIMELLPDEEKRFFHSGHCVKKCPAGMLLEDKYCVERCSFGHYRDVDVDETHCIPCNGICPKVCPLYETIDSINIKRLVNCTEIEGFIDILASKFYDHPPDTIGRFSMDMPALIPALNPAHLSILKTVRVVTGYVSVDGNARIIPGMPESLEFLENLEMIEGRRVHLNKFSLYVVGYKGLKWLGLKSLRKVKAGTAAIRRNPDICYSYSIPSEFFPGGLTWDNNTARLECEASGRVCDPTCDPASGCWGPGPGMCLKCKNFIRDGECSATCPVDGYFISQENSKICIPCHEQCSECTGPLSTDCKTCRNFEHWTREVNVAVTMEKMRNCVSTCPNGTYVHEKRCEPCHKACYDFGCTGPSAKLGDGGCNRCRYAVEENNVVRCLTGENEATVCHQPSSQLALNYVNALGPANISTFMCRKCPSECRRCTRESVSTDACECIDYMLINGDSSVCVSDCGKGSYIVTNRTLDGDNTVAGVCMKCHPFCDEHFSCFGTSAMDCERCAVGGVELNNTLIECLKECPPEIPVPYEGMCYDEDQEAIATRRRNVTIGIALMSAVLFALIISYLGYRCTKYRKKYEKEAQMHLPEIPALDPRKVTQRPNMRRLNLIAVDELDDSKNNILGQGAFGTVYAGKWKPPNRKDISIPVAIKVINKNEARHTTEAEMMKEAGLMASIQHEHLLPLVGICVAKDGVKIVTILRPLGSLLKFLKEHKERLGSKSLMLYCYQISSAMEFLARKKIVHRDLATRNVLVKNINHVEVTDFGLAQMLQGCDTSVVIDGRVAIKWLAIESLRQQVYTERTDVWSFGITCWEILTFGSTPYSELRLTRDSRMARDLASHLEKGYRLIQPTNCSQELYQELLNCWLGDPDSRPSFRQLKDRFELFCRAPHIYIQERRVTQRMDSITSSDQRQMIERLLQDTDFLDPVNLDPADYSHCIGDNSNLRSSNFFSTNTTETTLPPNSPCTPTRPLMGGDQRASISTTNSSRYKADPMARKYRLSADDSFSSTRTSETEILDDENYLMPRSIGMRSVIGKSIDEKPDEEEQEQNDDETCIISKEDNNVDYLPTYLNELDVGPETISDHYANSLAKTENPNSVVVADSVTAEEKENASENQKAIPYVNVQQCESTL